MGDPIERVEIEFLRCEAGWIDFTVSAGRQSVCVHATHIADPFAEMVSWLEDLQEGRSSCRLKVFEEGQSKVIAADPVAGNVEVTIVGIDDDMFARSEKMDDPCSQLYLAALAQPRQIAASLYKTFRDFVEGPIYAPDQWVRETLRDAVVKAAPQAQLDSLHLLDASTLNEFFWAIDPNYMVDFAHTSSLFEKIGKFVRYALKSDDVDDPEEIRHTPLDDFVPLEFDRWSLDERRKYLAELLDEPISGWAGDDLRSLVSVKLQTAGD